MNRASIRRRLLTASLALTLLVVAAACDSDDASGSGETLAAFFGWDEEEDPEAAQARWQDQDRQYQEAIRECMAREGFEYVPVDYSQGGGMYVDDWDPEEHARTQGFGVSTWYGNEEEFFDDGDDFHDPNWEIVEAMSDSEREAYYEAFHGSDEEMREHATIEYDEETGEEVGWSFSGWGFGCEGEAGEQVYGGGGGDDTQELWAELEPAFDEMYQRIQADPRMVEFEQEWSRCMSEAGYEFATFEAMQDWVYGDFQEEFNELLGDGGMYHNPFEGWSDADIEAFFEESTDDEIDAFYAAAETDQTDSIDEDALAAFQQREIDLAVAAYECGGDEDRWELHQEIAERYEADFIAENRATLERIREAEGR